MSAPIFSPYKHVESLTTAFGFTLVMKPKSGNLEMVAQHCDELVAAALESQDCTAALRGWQAGESGSVVCHFLFGAEGPLHRFTTQRETSKPYHHFRKLVDPLLKERLSVTILADLKGFVGVR